MAFNSVVPSPRYQDMTQNIVEYVPVPPTNMVNMNTPAAMMQQFKNLQQQQQQQMAALFGGNRGIQQGAFGSFWFKGEYYATSSIQGNRGWVIAHFSSYNLNKKDSL